MKKIKKLPLMLMLTLLFSALSPCALADSEELSPPELQSAAAIVIDMDTGRSLYDYNADEQRAPASLTKIMTVLLAVEAVDRGEASLDDSVTAGDEALDGMVEDGSTESIKVGETMSLRDLLYCAMLSSANEACNIIAVHISGSIDAFVSEMNARAAELGCTGTHFANTHGLPDSDHYTTARDLAVISREAMNNETFYELSGTTGYTVPATNMSEERRLNNTNGLINPESTAYPGNYYEYARAGKTGHTDEAGFCLASMAERDGVKLIAVVLGGQRLDNGAGGSTYTNFSDTRTLYNWVYNNFSMQEILSSTEIVSSVDVNLAANGGQAMLRPEESVSALVPKTGFSASSLEREITVYNELNGDNSYIYAMSYYDDPIAVITGHNKRVSQTGLHQLHHVQNAWLGKAKCDYTKRCSADCSGCKTSIFNINYNGSSRWQLVCFYEIDKSTVSSSSTRKQIMYVNCFNATIMYSRIFDC